MSVKPIKLLCRGFAGAALAALEVFVSDSAPAQEVGAVGEEKLEIIEVLPELWPQHARLGFLGCLNASATFSVSGTFGVSGVNPGAAGVGGLDRVYDDGRVSVDASGNNGGLTWNWAYENAGQYDSGAQRLKYSASDSYTTTGTAEVTDGFTPGFELAYGTELVRFERSQLGWEIGFGYLPISLTDNSPYTATVNRTVHSFDAAGIGKFPDAPYEGSFTGPGALLGDVAQLEAPEVITGVPVTGERELRVDHFNFRLGPTYHLEVLPRLAVQLSAGAAVGILAGELKYEEVLLLPDGSQAVNRGSSSSTEVLFSGYASALVLVHAVQHGDFYLGAQYMPLGTTTFSGAGRQAELDLSKSFYFSVGVNWPF
jgi:hypothetical protein